MSIIDSYDKFEAFCDDSPGPDGPSNQLTVVGSGLFTTSGCSAKLRKKAGSSGFGASLMLELVLTPPDDSTVVNPALSYFSVAWTGPGHEKAELPYSDVEFVVVGTDDDPPPMIKVTHLD